MVSPMEWANWYIRALSPYKPGKPIETLQRELGIKDSIKLASNENPLGPSPKALEALKHFQGDLASYPDASGHQLKAALSDRFGLTPNHISLGNGSEELIRLAIQAFAHHEHAILVPEYSFVIYELVAKSLNVQVKKAPLKGWDMDVGAILDNVDEQVKIIFIANPGNPTGRYITSEDLKRLLAKLPSDVLLVLDEAYFEYVDRPDYPQSLALLNDYPNLIITRTFSKAYGLAGLRLGYAFAHPEIIDLFARVRQAFHCNTLALHAGCLALDDTEHVARTKALNDQGLSLMMDYFSHQDVEIISKVGNFVTIQLKQDAQSVYQALLKEGVIVRPLAAYGLPRAIRVTIGTESQNKRFIQAFDTIGEHQ